MVTRFSTREPIQGSSEPNNEGSSGESAAVVAPESEPSLIVATSPCRGFGFQTKPERKRESSRACQKLVTLSAGLKSEFTRSGLCLFGLLGTAFAIVGLIGDADGKVSDGCGH
jgi:hypothetical protein